MTDLDLYSEIVVEDHEKEFENLSLSKTPEHTCSPHYSLLEAEVEALNAQVTRLEKERLTLLATKDQVANNFTRLGLACRREIRKLKSQIKLLCSKHKIPEPEDVSQTNLAQDVQIDPEKQNFFPDMVAYLHSDLPPVSIYSTNYAQHGSLSVTSKCDVTTQTEQFRRHNSRSSVSSYGSHSSQSVSSSSSSSTSSSSSSNHDLSSNNRYLPPHSRPAVSVISKKFERWTCHESIASGAHEKSCKLSKRGQDVACSSQLLVEKRLHAFASRSRGISAVKDDVGKQILTSNAHNRECAKQVSTQEKQNGYLNNQKILNGSSKNVQSLSKSRKQSFHTGKEYLSSPSRTTDQPSATRNSFVKSHHDPQIEQYGSRGSAEFLSNKPNDSCTGAELSSRDNATDQLLKNVETSVNLSRYHHSMRRRFAAPTHRNRCSRDAYHTNRTQADALDISSCSSEPKRKTKGASATLYTVRMGSKCCIKNVGFESGSHDPSDACHKLNASKEYLSYSRHSTPTTLILASSLSSGDIHTSKENPNKEASDAFNKPAVDSASQADKCSAHCSPKNDSFSSLDDKNTDLGIREVLGLTPPTEQESFEYQDDLPPIRSNSLSNRSEAESYQSQRHNTTIGNQEEGEISDDNEDAEVLNSSSDLNKIRKRSWSRSSHSSCKTPKLCSERQVNDASKCQVSTDFKHLSPYPTGIYRRLSEGSRNSGPDFSNLTYRVSPKCEDKHNTKLYCSSENHHHRASRLGSSASISPSTRNSRNEHHHRHHSYRSSHSTSKHRPVKRHYVSPERRDRSSTSSNPPRRRICHSPVSPNNANSNRLLFGHNRIVRRNRRFRVLSPILNRYPHRRLGVNFSKASGPRFGRDQYQHQNHQHRHQRKF
uniref:Uncharacterized protein n=1 Tax=Trichobilharzia regenti TaxID=157069 RepID=A0AA85KFV3_TRIRE|nr:unnamed protein product [Trichobilharzia regenti]